MFHFYYYCAYRKKKTTHIKKNILPNGHVVHFNLDDYVHVNNTDHNGLCENENVITFYSGINIYALLKGIFYNKFLKYDKYKT